ncbi:hypothetical protein UT300012_32690 [Paraclostridium bifermentans]
MNEKEIKDMTESELICKYDLIVDTWRTLSKQKTEIENRLSKEFNRKIEDKESIIYEIEKFKKYINSAEREVVLAQEQEDEKGYELHSEYLKHFKEHVIKLENKL